MTFSTLPLSGLSDDEEQTLTKLRVQLETEQPWFSLLDAYYRGMQVVQDLGISIPPEMRGLRTVIGWPRVVVDALHERLSVEGFRYGAEDDADSDLWDIWQASEMDDEHGLAILEALICRVGYITVGSPDEPGDPAVMCAESGQNLTAIWDVRTRRITSALRLYVEHTRQYGTLYLPDQTVALGWDSNGWKVENRDMHRLGKVPVARLVNRGRARHRDGESEITPELMSITDSACRTLLGIEVAREFFSAPQRYILGAKESDFQAADGTPKTAWQTYIGRVLALEADATGNAPTVGQFPAGDPSSMTNVLSEYARIVAGISGLPTAYLGIETVMPASADAIRVADFRVERRAIARQRSFSRGLEDAMRLAWEITHGAEPPADMRSLETLWASPAIPTIAATTDAIFKQVSGGIIPATSDVTLARLGYSAAERRRLEADRKQDLAEMTLLELSHSIEAKGLRTANTVAADQHPSPNKPGLQLDGAPRAVKAAEAAVSGTGG